MTGAMLQKMLMMCRANYPDYNTDFKAKGVLWMDEFIKEPDDLIETAIRSCITFSKKFPTVADIREAIRDLRYDEQSKPKQLAWEVKRSDSLHQKIMDMTSGKVDTKAYLQSVDITELVVYAKQYFLDISPELVLRNLNEFTQGKEKEDQCFACRMQKQACGGWKIGHYLDYRTGYVKNEMIKCNKQVRG